MNKHIKEIVEQLGQKLKQKKLMIVTAESCTGGGIAQAITDIAGSSAWFDRGFVTYSNESKVQMLQVKQSTLNEYGAVSEQVAEEMAIGALANSNADIAISVTGIAGPSGGSENKPVGTVYIVWRLKDGQVVSERHDFLGDRDDVRQQAVELALNKCLEQNT